MAKDIFRVGKVKSAGGIAAMSAHWDRSRETRNADPDRTPLNRVLHGSGNAAADCQAKLDQVQKIKKGSVLVIEGVCSASRDFFTDAEGKVNERRVDKWVKSKMDWLKEEYGDNLAAAVLHLDEHTPHIQFAVVPLKTHANGRVSLSAKDLIGDKQKLIGLQDRSAECVKWLGIERGQRGSKAEHTEIRDFYEKLPQEAEKFKAAVEQHAEHFRNGVREKLGAEVQAVRAELAAEREKTAQELASEREQVQTQRAQAERLLQAAKNTFQAARAEAGKALREVRALADRLKPSLEWWATNGAVEKYETKRAAEILRELNRVEEKAKFNHAGKSYELEEQNSSIMKLG